MLTSAAVPFAGLERDEAVAQREHARSRLRRNADDEDCIALNGTCDNVPACCNGQCYWENGWSLITDGVCVECVAEGQMCQKNINCCSGLQCDKDSRFDIDGFCLGPRLDGAECYQNSQCNDHCEKEWYEIYGICRDTP